MQSFFQSLAAESSEKIQSYLPDLNKEEDGLSRDEKGENKRNHLNVLERLLLSLEQGLLSEKEVFGEVSGIISLIIF